MDAKMKQMSSELILMTVNCGNAITPRGWNKISACTANNCSSVCDIQTVCQHEGIMKI